MTISGDVVGAAAFAASLRDAAHTLSDLSGPNRQVGPDVLAAVDPPRRSGALAATVHAETATDGVTIVAGSPSVPYAGVIHEGWPGHHIRAQPFITRGIDKTEDQIADAYEAHADQALSRVKGK